MTKEEILKHIQKMNEKDVKVGYASLQALCKESEKDNCVYPYMNTFVKMMKDENSYIRTRGFLLVAANVLWDEEQCIEQHVDAITYMIHDEKPITARQCIKLLPKIVKYKPHLAPVFLTALKHNDHIYQTSMQSLVQKDKEVAIRKIKQYQILNEEEMDCK